MIYLDNAATTRTAPEVVEAMLPYFSENYGNASSIYSLGCASKKALNQARRTLADYLGARQEEIYFTAGGSEADNWALKAAAEALSKQFARLVACSLLRQKAIPERFLLPSVRRALLTGDDYLLFPEMCPDVQTGRNAYYRNQIEFLVKHHIMEKREDGGFHPLEPVSAAEFAASLRRAMKLAAFPMENSLTQAGRALSPDAAFAAAGTGPDSAAPLTREMMALFVYRVYLFCFPVTDFLPGTDRPVYPKPPYMTDYNGSGIAFDDPDYDPNLTGQSAMYYPLVPWERLTDRDRIAAPCLPAARECYRLGLMRSETGIARGRMVCGTAFDPKVVVTREKAAKQLYFLQTLIHGIFEETDRF